MKIWGTELSFTTINVATKPATMAEVISAVLPRTKSEFEEVQKLRLSNKILSVIVV